MRKKRHKLQISMATQAGDVQRPSTTGNRPVRRFVFAGVGVVCVGIGAVGVVVPGLPTTIWLIAASYLFVRSRPELEAKLIRNRFFRPYLVYVDRPATMPRRAKITACVLMWGSSLVSLWLLASRDALTAWLAATIVIAASLGTWVVWRMGRRRE
jgi:uncharacterized membrane protein YbaN (DUF454 family)